MQKIYRPHITAEELALPIGVDRLVAAREIVDADGSAVNTQNLIRGIMRNSGIATQRGYSSDAVLDTAQGLADILQSPDSDFRVLRAVHCGMRAAKGRSLIGSVLVEHHPTYSNALQAHRGPLPTEPIQLQQPPVIGRTARKTNTFTRI